jgi:hypothetical protein
MAVSAQCGFRAATGGSGTHSCGPDPNSFFEYDDSWRYDIAEEKKK